MKRVRYESLLLLLIVSACVDPLARPTGRLGGPHDAASDQLDEGIERSSRSSRGGRTQQGVSYTTIEEVVQRPMLFHKRWVRVRGRITEVRFSPARRGRSAVITLVYLSDRAGNTMEVSLEDDLPLREGQEVTVEGRAMLLPTASSRSTDVVITAARVVTSSSDTHPETVTAPKGGSPKTASPKASPSRKPESTKESDEGQLF